MLWQDLRFGLRMLAKSPGFTVVAVLTLALGIGANTALFSVVNAVLLNPLPYPHPEELVTVHASKPNFNEGAISYPNFRDWQRDNKTLAALAVARGTGYSLTGMGDAEELRAELVSSDFFPLLGVKPIIGRLFAPGEDEIGREPLAIIGEDFWQRKFGSRPDAVGKVLTLDGRDYTIVGVLPTNFNLTINNFRAADLYVPIGQFQNPALNNRFAPLGIHGIARLKPGVTLAQAQDDMLRVSERLEKIYPEADQGIRAKLVSFQFAMVRDVKPLLLILMSAVGFVLLIACVNIANLLLVRSNARAQEFAVRSALGAGRSRLLRQLLTESLMLSLTGGAVGLMLAAWGTQVILHLLPRELPRAAEVHMSGTVLGFTLLISLASGTLFGLMPCVKVFRQNLQDTLKDGGRGTGGVRQRAQNWLVVVQMATTLVLLMGAGLMIRSLIKLSEVDTGFRSQGVLTFGLEAPPSMIGVGPDATRAYLRETNARIAATPGVDAVSFSWAALPMQSDDEQLFWLDGEPKPQSQNAMHWAIRYIVEPGYLKAMGIPLLKGRFLATSDDEHAPRAVVIDDVFARKFFGNEDPIGKRVFLEQFDGPATVVGVVGHVNQWGLDNDAVHPLRAEVYQAMMQMPPQQLGLVMMGMDVIVHSRYKSETAFQSIRNETAQMNHAQVVYNPESMESVIADTLAGRRFSMILLAVFAGTALMLASIGIYGVLSYLVVQHSRDIGVRMALGANRMAVFRWVLKRGGRLALFGAAVGVIAALGLTQVMASFSTLLYGVRPYDPPTMLGVIFVLMGVAFVACYLPARRAMRIDPMQVLRTE
ncbi:ABC transporter permease [Alloacidobacterium dinghuense]|uniref:ABC transporter permease n=2 Tax=Alloacidobacterium dinghuense TaxID=2763107 RepID=A0A7G8BRD4_9BACT|nr:ABC transporter permease [Alloacidobacterium dinghuense]